MAPVVAFYPNLFAFPVKRFSVKGRRSGRKYDVRCHATSLVKWTDNERYYYKEVPDFRLEYNTSAPGDFYELLGISQEADVTSIKAAFREKQRLVHPDIAGYLSARGRLMGRCCRRCRD